MLIFLEKVRKRTMFSIFEPIITEPLELMYIKAALDGMGIENRVIDPLFNLHPPEDELPDMVILTGYNVAQDEIIRKTGWWKERDGKILVMVSGVHAQINKESFRKVNVDFVFHSQDFRIFKNLISLLDMGEKPDSLKGVDINLRGGNWSMGEETPVPYPERVIPSREFYKNHRKKLRYLDKKDLALVKGGRSCPYSCSYCCCRGLNNNVYVKPDFKNMFEEIKEIGAENYWIVDDVFFTDKNSALDFIDASRRSGFKGSIVGYLRADFIVREKELLEDLYNAGLREVIIGFETPDEKELGSYNKAMGQGVYGEAIQLLKDSKIDITALFMVSPDYGIEEFRRLWRFIKNNRIEVYTISIFTPLQGSVDFEDYRNRLMTENPEKFDFLHLVLPSKLPKPIFYILFYLSHTRLLLSKRIWKYILAR
ncbi:MAG: B12-binding domain-containing radical SAM protein [Bacillota bacterium]